LTEVLICVALPFLGTMAGAAMVFFMPRHGRRGELRPGTRGALMGFAAGVMTAASFWSLLIPAIGLSVALGVWAFVPATAGFCLGVALILGLDRLSPYLFRGAQVPGRRGETMLMAAVTLHNLPEGMAVGVACAGLMLANGGTTPPYKMYRKGRSSRCRSGRKECGRRFRWERCPARWSRREPC